MANGRSVGRGGASPNVGRVGAKPDWTCGSFGGNVCKATKTPYLNFGRRETCLKCGLHKGSCNATNVLPKTPSVSVYGPQGANRKMADELSKAKKEIAELKKGKGQLVVETVSEEEDNPDKIKLDRLRKDVQSIKKCTFEGADKLLEGLQAQIKGLEAQGFHGKPLLEQSKIVQAKLAKCRKDEEGIQKRLDGNIEAMAALSKLIDEDREKGTEKQTEIQDLTVQANDLNAKMAGAEPGELSGPAKSSGKGEPSFDPVVVKAAFVQQGLSSEHADIVNVVLRQLGILTPAAETAGGAGMAGAEKTKEKTNDSSADADGDLEMEWKELVAEGWEDDATKKEVWIKVQQKKRKTTA